MATRKTTQNTSPAFPPYQPPTDEQIIVWEEDRGKPFVLAILDEVIQPSPESRHNTYKEFVQLVGPTYAEAAVRLYQMDTAEEQTEE
jgi:hypothetical protein